MSIREIEAYQTTDGQLFDDVDKAIDHQEGLQAAELLRLINLVMPERYRNQLTHVDWHQVQCHFVKEVKHNKNIFTVLNRLIDTIAPATGE